MLISMSLSLQYIYICILLSAHIIFSINNSFPCYLQPSMEASQPLSIESFSYSWLVNLKLSPESVGSSMRASLDASDEASFIDMDPRLTPSKRFRTISNSHDFKFDLPQSSSLGLVHADELFSGGYLVPRFAKSRSCEGALDLTPSSSQATNPTIIPENKVHSSSRTRRRRLSKRIFHKYFHILSPLYRIIRSCKLGSKREKGASRNCVYPADASPRVSSAYSIDDWRRSCDSESSIYEAVLHCKRSIGT